MKHCPEKRPLRALRALPLLGVAWLAGCGSSTPKFPPACPHVGMLPDAADITRFRSGRAGGSGRDLTDMVLDGRITGVDGSCARDSSRVLAVTVRVSMALTRGPAARGASESVPFFLAVLTNGEVVDKQVFRVPAEFGTNVDTVRLTSDPITLTLPIGPDKRGSAYDVVAGFQLTPAEIAANRARGPR